MIELTRLNHDLFYLNPDLVQEMESTPDTVLTLTTGARVRVSESPAEVIERVVAFRRRIQDPHSWPECSSPEARPASTMDEVLESQGRE